MRWFNTKKKEQLEQLPKRTEEVTSICGFKDLNGKFHETEGAAHKSNAKIKYNKILNNLVTDYYKAKCLHSYEHYLERILEHVLNEPQPILDAIEELNKLK
jgi:hypothetical protein